MNHDLYRKNSYKKAAVLLLLAGVALIFLGWKIKAIEGLCYAVERHPVGISGEEKQGTHLHQLLNLFAYFAPENISAQWLSVQTNFCLTSCVK